MKKRLAIILLVLLCVVCILTACNKTERYTITSPADSYTLSVGETVDFKSYFTITDNKKGENIPVTDDMIYAPEADLTKAGVFDVTCTYEEVSKIIFFTVQASTSGGGSTDGGEGGSTGGGTTGGEPGGDTTDTLGTQNNPYTVESALALLQTMSNGANTEKVYIKGVVISVGEVSNYIKNVVIADTQGSSTTLNMYSADPMQSSDLQVKAGDTILIYGYLRVSDKGVYDIGTINKDYCKFSLVESSSTGGGTTGGGTTGGEAGEKGTKQNPYTVAEALAVLESLTNDSATRVYVQGIVTDAGEAGKTYSANIYIADSSDGTTLWIATASPVEGETETLEVGDTVLIYGGLRPGKNGGDGNMGTINSNQYVNYDIIAKGEGGSTGGGATGGGTTGGETGGESGGDTEETPAPTTTISTTFKDSTDLTTLECNQDGLEFVVSKPVAGWDTDTHFEISRGLQFMKANGTVTLTSANKICGVTVVIVDVSSNKSDKSTIVSVTVGGVALQSDGASSVTITNANHTLLVFTSSTALDGAICVTLTPSTTTGSSLGSMYIYQIKNDGTDSGQAVVGGETGSEGSGATSTMMPTQTYDASKHSDARLNERIADYAQANFGAGLPTTTAEGEACNVLVVPVQFKDGATFTDKELADLEIAFNGTATDTGWESVKTYYQKSSYGKLNLHFDIQDVVTVSQGSTYYKEHVDNENYYDGSAVLMDEVCAKLDATIDFNNYNKLNDGCIDAVYMIYCEAIAYNPDENDVINPDFFWAYQWAYDPGTTYDGLIPYTHLFAGVDFMYEDIEGSDPYTNNPISGLKINATTYIHETGHVLGLDDYYDYGLGIGSDMGVGGADMMDATKGDHNPYSKIMLGWVTPTIVTTAGEYDLYAHDATENGGVIMLLLDYDGTYFCEYLLIEFYSNTELNALHTDYLYDGASCGVRIYHVSSSCDNPYSYVEGVDDVDQYYSFTDNNNSITEIPLIKLIEADGDSNFQSNYDGYADANDLWQEGDKLSVDQAGYTRNDGKLVNFDIEITEVVDGVGATISITFLTAE